MTRINVVDPELLPDQFLMAEYRELPMVMASARRSLKAKNPPKLLDHKYTLNAGHVRFFYNKAVWLEERYKKLIHELRRRKFKIAPDDRTADFSVLYNFKQMEWESSDEDLAVNLERLRIRVQAKPLWYKWWHAPMPLDLVKMYNPAIVEQAFPLYTAGRVHPMIKNCIDQYRARPSTVANRIDDSLKEFNAEVIWCSREDYDPPQIGAHTDTAYVLFESPKDMTVFTLKYS